MEKVLTNRTKSGKIDLRRNYISLRQSILSDGSVPFSRYINLCLKEFYGCVAAKRKDTFISASALRAHFFICASPMSYMHICAKE